MWYGHRFECGHPESLPSNHCSPMQGEHLSEVLLGSVMCLFDPWLERMLWFHIHLASVLLDDQPMFFSSVQLPERHLGTTVRVVILPMWEKSRRCLVLRAIYTVELCEYTTIFAFTPGSGVKVGIGTPYMSVNQQWLWGLTTFQNRPPSKELLLF